MIDSQLAKRPSRTPSWIRAGGVRACAHLEGHRALAVAVAFVSVAAWIAGAASAQESAAPDESTGTVVALDGTPVAGVSVQVYRDAGLEKTLVSDRQGRFPVPNTWWEDAEQTSAPVHLLAHDDERRIGWFDFSAHAAQRRRGQLTWSPLVSADVRITLLPCQRAIHGRLAGPAGQPLAGVTVQVAAVSQQTNLTLDWYGVETSAPWPLPQAITDRDGRFELRVPESACLRLRTHHPDWVTRLLAPDQKEDLGDIELAPAGKLVGCVTDAHTGKPTPSARIVVRGAAQHGGRKTSTDANGRYAIGGLEPDHYSVQVESVAANPHLVALVRDPLLIEAGKTSQADFTVREGVRITGRVVDAISGEPLPEASVSCRITRVPEQSTVAVFRRAWVNAEGRFEVWLPPGICQLGAHAGMRRGVDDSRRTIELGEASPEPIVLRLGPEYVPSAGSGMFGGAYPPPSLPRVAVELRSKAGPPLGGLTVRQIYRGGNSVSEWSVGTAPKFEKEFAEADVGRAVSLLIDLPGFAQARSPEFVIGKNMPPLVIELQPAEYVPIQGRVVDRDGQPLEKTRIRVRRIFFGSDVQFPWGPETVSGEDGRFTVKHVRLGDCVVIRVDREDIGGTETEPFLVSKPEPILLPDRVLRVAEQVISGIVTDQAGFPVAGVAVVYVGETLRRTETDAAGRFVLDRLPEGRLSLSLSAADGSQARPTVVAGSKDVRLFLPLRSQHNRPENMLTMSLRTTDGKTPAEAEFFVLDLQRRKWLVSGGFEGRDVRSVDLGSSLRRFPADRLAVAVLARDYALPAPVAIVTQPEIEPVTVTLEPAPGVKLTGRIVDAEGQPVPGAGVGLSRTVAEGTHLESWKYLSNVPDKVPLTGPDGRFEFLDLPRGLPVAVYANKAGFAGVWSARITVGTAPSATLPDLHLLKATRELSGRIVGKDEKPLSGARIFVHDFSRPETTSDDAGRFRLRGVPDGELLVVASAPGYDRGTKMVSVEAAAQEVVLPLVPDPRQYFPP